MHKSQVAPPPLHFPEGTWEQLITLLAKSKQPMELEDEYDND